MRHRLKWNVISVLVTLALIGLWELISRLGLVSPVFLPSPSRVASALWNGVMNRDLGTMVGATVSRMIGAWIAACIAGILLGTIIGTSERLRPYIEPSLELLRPLPATAIIPVAIAFLGLSEVMVLSIICFGALWPVLLATVHGVSVVEPRLKEVSKILMLSRYQYLSKIALPNAIPDIVGGMKLSLTIALILTVVGEMLSSSAGIGQDMMMASRMFRSADLYAGVVVLSLIGYLSSAVISAAESRALLYRR